MTRIAMGEGELPTAAECAYIRALWARLPGNYSYSGTISRIAGGGTLEDPWARQRSR